MLTLTPFRRATHGGGHDRLAVLVVTLAWMISMAHSSAATVLWSGAGGDNLWSNPANWTGGALPDATNDVVIDVPGEFTVRMDVPNTTVRSLQCVESFTIENGPFTVTGGASVVHGEFGMGAAQFGGHTLFEAKGPGTTFTASGAVTNLVGLQATDGAVLAFSALRQIAPISSSWYMDWSATGAGSAILFPNLTNIVLISMSLNIRAYSGAEIDLRALWSADPRVGFSASGLNSLVNLSGLSGLFSGRSIYEVISLSADNEGTVHIPNVTALDFVHVNVGSLGTVPTAQLRSFTGGSLSISSQTNSFENLTNFSGSIYASNSRLDWTNVTTLNAATEDLRITAYDNSVIDLSSVTNVVMNPSYGLQVRAYSGGRIDLRALRKPVGRMVVESGGGDSVVDLSGFTGLWEANNSSVRADDGGSVLIPNVTAMDKVSLTVNRGSLVATEQLRSGTDVTFTLYGRTNSLSGLTNFTGYLFVSDTRLDLTNFTVLYATNSQMYFQAEQGSFIDLSRVTNVIGNGLNAFARGGSRIDLSGLRMSEGPVTAGAYEAGSLVDLSGISGVWRGGSVTAEAGGTVLIPNVTALEGVYLNVNADANVNLAQLNSITGGNITLRKRTNDLTGLTNFNGQITAIDSRLYLTNLHTLYVTNHTTIQAEQGSLIDLSRITNVVRSDLFRILDLNAYDSSIDLSGLRVPDKGYLRVNTQGPNGLVDFSGFSGLWEADGGVSLGSSGGGTVAIQNVTETRGVSFNLSGDARMPVAQLRSVREGSIRLTTQTNVFAALTNFTGTMECNYQSRAEFPGLTQLTATNSSVGFSAVSGGVVDLSQVTNAVAKPHSLSLSASYGGRIEIRNLETIVAGQVDVRADGTDAVVDLSGLTGFFSDNNSSSLRTTSGGVILLNSDAMLLAGVAIDFQGNPGGVLPPFLAPSQSLVLYGQPWRSYRIESRDPSVADSPWSLYRRVPLTEPLEMVSLRPPRDLVLRVRAFIADPPEVDLRSPAPGITENILFGVPERTYRLESTGVLGDSINWEHGPATTLTNSFFIFPRAGATNDARFFRAREM